MVVVVGAVQVGGHDRNEVGAVLPVEELAVFQAADLRKGVGLVGFFQLTGQKAGLCHGLGRHAGIDAGGAKEQQLLAAVLPRAVYDVHLQHHIVVHEVGQSGFVGHNPADFRRSQHHIVRPFLREKGLHRLLTHQVQLLMRAGQEIGIALTRQFPADCRPDHPAMAGHVDFPVLVHHVISPRLSQDTRPNWS